MTNPTPDPIDEWDGEPATEADLIAKSQIPAPGEPDAPIDLPNDWAPEGATDNGN